MAGVKGKSGGVRKGAGRKPKADEIKLIEQLDNIIDSDEVIKQLKNLVLEGNLSAIKLYMEYRYGKPKEQIELKHIEALPIFNINE
jgi:hypothetical protein